MPPKKSQPRKKARPKSGQRSSTKKASAKRPAGKRNKKVQLSALDAAARVLKEKQQPMNCRELIEAMAAKKYWQSPHGKTPERTLYAALHREIRQKGDQSRFRQLERGRFALA